MAQTLSDVVYRRTGLGATSIPDDATLQATANTMAETLSWDAPRIAEEIARARNPLA